MSYLLVSFCNTIPSHFILGVYDFENAFFQWIDTTGFEPECGGATGIAIAEGHYWIVRQAIFSDILRLDANFKALKCYPLSISKDAHSLIPFDGGFLIADTLHNGVNLARLSPDGSGFVSTPYWSQYRSDKDEIHVNSICTLNGEVYVSFFGEKPGNGWATTQTGQIINITTGEVICDKLQHPHTLLTWSGAIYWLESKTGILHRYTPGVKHETLLHLDGYVRGLAFDDDFIYIGASAARRHSRSMGTLNKIASRNPDDFCCWIYRVSQKTGDVERHNLTCYGSEIYDLLSLSSLPFGLSRNMSIDAVTRRLQQFEDVLHDRTDALQQCSDSLQQCNNSLQQCSNSLQQCQDERSQLSSENAVLQAELARIHRTKWWRCRAFADRFLRPWLRQGKNGV
jgi:hypothetical protein